MRISNKIIEENKLSEMAIVCYGILQDLFYGSYWFDKVYIDEKFLANNIYGEGAINKRRLKKISDALGELNDTGVLPQQDGFINIEDLQLPEGEYYTCVHAKSVIKIFRSVSGSPEKAFKYLLVLLHSRNFNICEGKVGYMPLIFFIKRLGYSENTIIKYGEQLEALKIIYIRKGVRKANGKMERNCYGLYEDREQIEAFKLDSLDKYN